MKKGFSIFLIVIMVLLAGCGNEAINEKEDKKEQSSKLVESEGEKKYKEYKENREIQNPVEGYQFLGLTLELNEKGQVKIKEVYDELIDKSHNHGIWNGHGISKWNGEPVKKKLKELVDSYDDEDENVRLQRALRTMVLRDNSEGSDKDESMKIQYRTSDTVYDIKLFWKYVEFTYEYEEAAESDGKKVLMLQNGMVSLEDKYKNYRKAGDELFYYFQKRGEFKTAVIKPRNLGSWSEEDLENLMIEVNKRTPDVVILKLEDIINDEDTNIGILVDSLVNLNKGEEGSPVVVEKNHLISKSGEKLIKELQTKGIQLVSGDKLEELIEPKEPKKYPSDAEFSEEINSFKKVTLDKSCEDGWDEELVIHYKDYILNPYTRISIEERKHPDELVIRINNARYSRFRLKDFENSDIVKNYYGLMTLDDDLWRVALRLKKPVKWELTKKYNPYRHVLKMKIKDAVQEESGFVILTNELMGERIGGIEDSIEGSKIVDIGNNTYLQVGIFKDEEECKRRLSQLREEFKDYSEWLSFTYKRLEDVEY